MISKQEANSYGYVVVRHDGKSKEPVVYRGEDPVLSFIRKLMQEKDEMNQIVENPIPLDMTDEEKQIYTIIPPFVKCANKPFLIRITRLDTTITSLVNSWPVYIIPAI